MDAGASIAEDPSEVRGLSTKEKDGPARNRLFRACKLLALCTGSERLKE